MARAEQITVNSWALASTILFFPLLISTVAGFNELMEDPVLATVHDGLLLVWGFGLNWVLLRMRANAREKAAAGKIESSTR